jgi:hypothetical protein
MACYHPLTAWRSLKVNPSGKHPLSFTEHEVLPFSKLEIPCGRCIGCRIDRSQQWGTRIMHEARYHEKTCFLLLTYDDQHLPEHGQLVPPDAKKFCKAVNDKFGPELRRLFGHGVRYFLCGEYGDLTGRPHYHVILFGVDFAEDRKPWKKSGKHQLWRSETATRLWGRGNVDIGSLSEQSGEYAARYCLKKVNGEMAKDHYARIDPATGEWFMLHAEFIRMSNKPGIGRLFFDDPANRNMYDRGGFPRNRSSHLKKIPRYYDSQLEKVDPDRFEEIKRKRKKDALKRKADNTPERLAVREEIQKAKVQQLPRVV